MRPASGRPRLNPRDGTPGPRPAHLPLLAQRSPSSAQRHGKGVLRLFRVLEAPWSGSAGPIYMNCARPKPAPATPSMGRESVIHANADLVEGATEAEAEAPPEGFARYACLVPLLSRMMIIMMIKTTKNASKTSLDFPKKPLDFDNPSVSASLDKGLLMENL